MSASSEPIPLESVASLPEFHHPVVSPDGSRVAFFYDEPGRNELFVLDRDSGEYEPVTDGEVPRDASWWIRWGKAGERVYFHRDEDGDEQNDIYAVTPSGEVESVVAVDGQGMVLDSDSEDRFLLYASDEGSQLNLYRHDFDAEASSQLTEYEQPVKDAIISPDDDRIAYVTNESSNLENTDAYVMDADGSHKRRLDVGEDGSETAVRDWFPEGDRLLVSDDAEDVERAGIYDLRDDTVRWLGDGGAEEFGLLVSPGGRYVLAGRVRAAAMMPMVYDLETGRGRELDVPEGTLAIPMAGQLFADETTLVFKHSTAAERPELYEYDLETDETRILLDAAYGDIDPDAFVDAEAVTYESDGGTEAAETYEIEGLLYDPRNGPAREASETDVPGVVHVHGGPHGWSLREFDVHVQFLVSRGYAVFQPNYRGSLGRGRAFKNAIHGDWGGAEQADIANGGRWLQDREWIDEDRVAVFGGSYGGYSVYCQLTQYPTLWATGVAWVGITDLHELFADDMAHFKHQLRMQMGDPEANEDLWRDRSPIEHVERMERPICIVHGVNDPRCPIEQARRFRDALEDRGWEVPTDFEYEELTDEGHGSTDIQQKIRVFRILDDYLDRRL